MENRLDLVPSTNGNDLLDNISGTNSFGIDLELKFQSLRKSLNLSHLLHPDFVKDEVDIELRAILLLYLYKKDMKIPTVLRRKVSKDSALSLIDGIRKYIDKEDMLFAFFDSYFLEEELPDNIEYLKSILYTKAELTGSLYNEIKSAGRLEKAIYLLEYLKVIDIPFAVKGLSLLRSVNKDEFCQKSRKFIITFLETNLYSKDENIENREGEVINE